jgi:CheY-like chemotaxis protein
MGIRLLVIEDDRDIAFMLERALSKSGFDVKVCPDGQAGIDAFRDGHYDVVLTDWLLPERDGLAVVEAIRSLPGGHEVGIGLMSGVMSVSGIRETLDGEDIRIDAWFDKPFSLSEIRSKLRQISRGAADGEDTDTGAAVGDSDPGTDDDADGVVIPIPFAAEGKFIELEGIREVAKILVALSRQVFTGMLTVQLLNSTCRVGFLRGVIVGAQDDRQSNSLGQRLLRRGKLTHEQLGQIDAEMTRTQKRFAEAALELDLLDGMIVFEEIEGQVLDCLNHILDQEDSEVSIVLGEEHLRGLGSGSVDLLDLLLAWARRTTNDSEAQRWFIDHREEPLYRLEEVQAFERALDTFEAGSLPDSFAMLLPANLAIFGDGMSDVERAKAIHTLWLAGMVGLEDDRTEAGELAPSQSVREEGDQAREDRILAARLMGLWQRVQDQNLYQFLEVSAGTSPEAIQAAVDVHASIYSPHALSGRALGPARKTARRLWQRLEEARATLLDGAKRSQYDAELALAAQAHSGVENADALFEQAKRLLDAGKEKQAVKNLEALFVLNPQDPVVGANLALARHRVGKRLLEDAHEMLDGFLLQAGDNFEVVWARVMLAVADDDEEAIKRWLSAAAEMNPDHPDVQASLRAYEVEKTSEQTRES